MAWYIWHNMGLLYYFQNFNSDILLLCQKQTIPTFLSTTITSYQTSTCNILLFVPIMSCDMNLKSTSHQPTSFDSDLLKQNMLYRHTVISKVTSNKRRGQLCFVDTTQYTIYCTNKIWLTWLVFAASHVQLNRICLRIGCHSQNYL